MEFSDAWHIQFTKSGKTAADETPAEESPTIECDTCGTKLPTVACENCEGSREEPDYPGENCGDCDGTGRQLDESSPLVDRSRYERRGGDLRKIDATCNHHGTGSCTHCDQIRNFLEATGMGDYDDSYIQEQVARHHVAEHRNPITGQDYWDRPENQ